MNRWQRGDLGQLSRVVGVSEGKNIKQGKSHVTGQIICASQ